MTTPDTPPTTIRPATRADLPAIAACIDPFVRKGKLLERTADELESLLPGCFVAEFDGKIVGCAALEVYSSKLAEVRSLVVTEDLQGKGIGKLLVKACIDRAASLRVLEVMAITSSEEFFRSCGFDFTLPGEKKALFFQTRDL